MIAAFLRGLASVCSLHKMPIFWAALRDTSHLPAPLRRTSLHFEALELRMLPSVSSIGLRGDVLVIKADDNSAVVTVREIGSMIHVSEAGSGRHWHFATDRLARIEFRGGRGNDRFVNQALNLPIHAMGGAGSDFLHGGNRDDVLIGGDGNDILLGYDGDDQLSGGNGDDVLRGGDGDDRMEGNAGNDRLFGDEGNDQLSGGDGDDCLWGGNGNDVLLGGYGNDQLRGDEGDDRLNGQGGRDSLIGGDGNDVLISIDAAFGDYLQSGAGADVLWIDHASKGQDRVVGVTKADVVQQVPSFTNNADLTLNGDRLDDPIDSGQTARFANVHGSFPLFGSKGPLLEDVRQGAVNDCYLLAGLAAIARDNPHALRQNVVDFDDGTYGVRLGDRYFRVDSDLPVRDANKGAVAENLKYARLGHESSLWVAIIEKAFAFYRRGANSYASINIGSGVEVNRAFRSSSATSKTISSYDNAVNLAKDIAMRVATAQAVTICFRGQLTGNVPLITSHVYTVAAVSRQAGARTSITLRNPWGRDGAGSDGRNDGLVTLTAAQIFAQGGFVSWGRV